MAQRQNAYDAIPYPSNPFRQSRPERLAAVAKLFGMDGPAPETCRVLELGCSMGGNLIVIAQDHPGARCIGIDASSRQIAEGWKTVDALGLKNIQLRHQDILEVGDELGQFANGSVFTPDEVTRERDQSETHEETCLSQAPENRTVHAKAGEECKHRHNDQKNQQPDHRSLHRCGFVIAAASKQPASVSRAQKFCVCIGFAAAAPNMA